MEHAGVRDEYISTRRTRVPQTQVAKGRLPHTFNNLRMFWGFPPFPVIIDTCVSKDTVKSNRLPVGSRVAGILRIKHCTVVRFEG